MSRACALYLRAAVLAWAIALVLVLLSACGGGDDDECDPDTDPHCRKTTEPVDCRANPEKCQ